MKGFWQELAVMLLILFALFSAMAGNTAMTIFDLAMAWFIYDGLLER